MNSKHSENWHRPDLDRRLGADEWTRERDDGTHDWCCPHPSLEGENRCVFHLPLDHPRKTAAEQKSQLRESVNGDSDYYEGVSEELRCSIVGATFFDLDLSETVIESDEIGAINLKHSLFSGNTDWTGATLAVPIQLNGATFEGDVDAPDAMFDERVGFQGVDFRGKANFNSANFGSEVRFTDADFGRRDGQRAIFNHATFAARTRFDSVSFHGDASFFRAEFRGTAQFSSERGGGTPRKTEFLGPARFSGTRFAKECHFINAVFEEEADFSGVMFEEYTGFSGSDFVGEMNFEKAVFEGRTYFRGIEPAAEITFTRSRFAGEGYFDDSVLPEARFRNAELTGVDFEKTRLTGASFRSADLTGTSFYKSNLEEANLEDSIIDKTDLRHTDLSGALLYHAFLAAVRINDATRFGARELREGTVENVEGTSQYELLARDDLSVPDRHDLRDERSSSELWNQASWTYNRLVELSRRNVMLERRLVYRYKKGEADRRHALKQRRYGPYLVLWIHRLSTGYGDRFFPIGAWSAVTVVASALLYLVFGFESRDGTVYRGVSPTSPEGQQAILKSLQFSVAEFGFGSVELSPVGLSNLVVIFESLFGTLLFALLGFVIARRLP